jgi:thiamine-phosphate pyrophosphorylase
LIHGLYAITPDASEPARLMQQVAAALQGGVSVLQYRRKKADAEAALREATELLSICRRHEALFIVNDDARLAAAVGAVGVHLGREDGGVAEARRLLGAGAIVGVSCSVQISRAQAARAEGADYVAFGSFFPSSVKPHAVRATIGLLQEARKCFDTPIVVIGGITLDNAEALIEAGADAVAVISDLFDAPDVRDRATAFGRLFEGRLIESRGRDEGSARG